ncbi:MAG: cytochrome c oxidase subunit II, partial [Magnetococcales bacterium]|nr:cytochrome c oxidase subunit II [Magnetococcales bacterium]
MFRTPKKAGLLLGAAGTLLGPASAWADFAYNLQEPVTPIARELYGLHDQIVLTIWLIGIFVFGLMFYSFWKFRKSQGAKPASFHENTLLEIIWTIVPFVILISIAIPATKTFINMYDTEDSDITIKAVGIQWKWKYEYVDEGISFMSVLSTPMEQIRNEAPKGENYLLEVTNNVVVPVNKKIRILTT